MAATGDPRADNREPCHACAGNSNARFGLHLRGDSGEQRQAGSLPRQRLVRRFRSAAFLKAWFVSPKHAPSRTPKPPNSYLHGTVYSKYQ